MLEIHDIFCLTFFTLLPSKLQSTFWTFWLANHASSVPAVSDTSAVNPQAWWAWAISAPHRRTSALLEDNGYRRAKVRF